MNAVAQKTKEPATMNGVDVAALFATIDAVKKDPAIAEFRFRARNRWLGGDANCTIVSGFTARSRSSRMPPRSRWNAASRRCCSAATAVRTRWSSC